MDTLARTIISFVFTFGFCVIVESVIEWILRRSNFFSERKRYAAIAGFVLALMLFASLSLSSSDLSDGFRDLIPKGIALLLWLSIQLILIAKDKKQTPIEEARQTEEQES